MKLSRNTEITIVILILVGVIAITVALALANQAEQEFERNYALKQFVGTDRNLAYSLASNVYPEQVQICTKYNTDVLKIINTSGDCTDWPGTIAYWLKAGYKIASATDLHIYMTK